MLRELAQNEFDAGGSRLEVTFEPDGLRVRGNGRTIDRAGWNRLTVMSGTGEVPGTNIVVEEKPNGIGSKNFGLRSLFVVGDVIHVRSGGRHQALDHRHGAYDDPKPDPESRGVPGVEIWVPYRVVDHRYLPAFDLARETAAVASLASGLAATLTKLALPGRRRSLNEVVVRSDRLNRTLTWRQNATEMSCRAKGVRLIRRSIRLDDSGAGQTRIVELEFVRTVAVPAGFQGHRVPGYFDRWGGRVAIGVSLRLAGRRLDPAARGVWFYPIGVIHGYTGSGIGVCAPFDMDNDRSAILPSVNSKWNEWLAGQAADLAADLLPQDLWERFGADAYRALWPDGEASDPEFADRLRSRLSSDALWPMRRVGRAQQPRFAPAAELVIPDDPRFDAFLPDESYPPAKALAHPGFRSALRGAGALVFTLNSLVRLRCAHPEGPALKTPEEKGVADYHYTDGGRALRDPKVQVQFADALDAMLRDLTADNKDDLRASPTTLAADGSLQPAAHLQRVPPELVEGEVLPPSSRLHPALLGSRAMQRLVDPFKPFSWAGRVAARAAAGTASEVERRALYAFLQSQGSHLPVQLTAMLRKAPVLRDRRGAWVRPVDLFRRSSPGARAFAPVLRFPHPEIASASELLRAFHIRERMRGEDLVAYARLVAAEPGRAAAFAAVLTGHRPMLTPPVLQQLRGIAFMPNSRGGVAPPLELYVDTPRLRACVGDTAAFAAGTLGPKLQARLGCRTEPAARDMLAHLRALAESGSPPADPEPLYAALLPALGRAKIDPRSLAAEPVLWTGAAWAPPQATLLGAGHARLFADAIPRAVPTSNVVLTAFERLGATRTPQRRHWLSLLAWLGMRYGAERVLPSQYRLSVRAAYVQLGSDAVGIPSTQPVLLGQGGLLHSLTEAQAGRFALVDDPAMAEAIREAHLPVALADDREPRTLQFYSACGVRSLRDLRVFVRFRSSGERPPPPRLAPDEILRSLHEPWRASALAVFASHRLRRQKRRAPRTEDLSRRLRGIQELAFVREIWETYRIGGRKVPVPVRARLDGHRLLLAGIRSRADVMGALAEAVAAWLPPVEPGEWTDSVFRLLSCEDAGAARSYLSGRGVPWTPPTRSGGANPGEELDTAIAETLGPLFSGIPPGAPSVRPGRKKRPPAPRPPLPDLDEVEIELVPTGSEPLPPKNGPGRKGSRGGGFGGDPVRDEERDRELGRRGEALVLRMERERLRKAGLAEEEAVWTAETDPSADHDILSRAPDGGPLWIEVKSTSGQDGRFRWSRAEFELAVRAGERYVLYRVYNAGTKRASVRAFPNPVARLLDDAIRLDIAVLQAEVSSL
ncbi:MAG TPA: DUF3883 domain-containing protein [Longimicrobiaceae bacterium]|nr:DUF3883 domain-containing protein [Longimicrobiaceae bacterium]